MSKALFKITLTKWHEHNPGTKNTYKRTMVSNNLINDAKVLALPLSQRWLFINLLLICGDYASDTVTLNEQQLNDILTARGRCEDALLNMQSLQLLTFEKTLLNKEIKEIKKEKKERKEVQLGENEDSKILNSEIWEAYKSAFVSRYKVEPIRNASVNSKISQLAKRLGPDAIPVVQFYLTHNDSFFIKNTHPIGVCLSNAETLHTQWQKGHAITSANVRRFEKVVGMAEMVKDAEKGGF